MSSVKVKRSSRVHPVTTAGGSEHGRGVRGEDVGILRRRCGWIHLVAEGPIPGEGVSPEEELKRDVICQGEAEQEVMVDVSSQGVLWPASQRRIVHPIWTASKSFHIEYQAACVLPILVVMPPRPFPILYSRSERNHREKIGVRVLFEQCFGVHCNDSKLNVCSVEEVCKTQAYILFYTQRTLQDKAGIPEKQLQAQVFATQNQ
ncbi:hypothetical protein DUI87_31134 [Hirundo rustica rustica]|uniref:Uncharacterized protein n=1 Tax=Hirundo rustica rustica TaxID=333673 RepID=A0A3M0IUD3_HIRRU|nr:hypothetical protein DUI87_31134 [Hirundo rustica rustica]